MVFTLDIRKGFLKGAKFCLSIDTKWLFIGHRLQTNLAKIYNEFYPIMHEIVGAWFVVTSCWRGMGLAEPKRLLDKIVAESSKCVWHAWVRLNEAASGCFWDLFFFSFFFLKCWTYLILLVSSLEPFFIDVNIWVMVIIIEVIMTNERIGHFPRIFIWLIWSLNTFKCGWYYPRENHWMV